MGEDEGASSEAIEKLSAITMSVREHLEKREAAVYIENLISSIDEIRKVVREHALTRAMELEAIAAIYDALTDHGHHETAAELAERYGL